MSAENLEKMTKDVCLQIHGITFGYSSKREVLTRVTFDCAKSGIYAILGPNGSGKSTLLKCIMQLQHASAGAVLFNGESLMDKSVRELSQLFGYVPQDCSTNFPITVFDRILLGRKPYIGWNPTDYDLDMVEKNICMFGLEPYALKYVNELSGGERQRVMIAAALAKEPQILVFDEPTSSLDIKHQIDVMKHVRSIVQEKSIIVLIAVHDLNLAAQYADQVVILKKGSVFSQGAPGTTLNKENIRAVYDIDVAIYKRGDVNHIVPLES
ncbi:MAG TPA: ABC transporter ATP-binding protein [Clostridiaceae bacterium]|jgi:iron complex transport system ATP-binding protein|nr:ABC transporter ATP-binding protein [Clostridiaceae bacterium]